jgi:hypothetical protein
MQQMRVLLHFRAARITSDDIDELLASVVRKKAEPPPAGESPSAERSEGE